MSTDRRSKAELLAELEVVQQQLQTLQLAQAAGTSADAPLGSASADAGTMIQTTPGELPIGHIGPQARLLNLKPPQIAPFCGEREETARFVSAIDRALAAAGMMDSLGGFHFAASHFEGSVQTWFESIVSARTDIASWPALRPLLEKEFELVNAKRVYESRLLALMQTGSAQAYVDEFRSLSLKVTFEDDFLQYRFRMGLCNFLREKMVFQTPNSLLELQRLTLLVANEFPAESTADSGRKAVPLVAAAFGRNGGKGHDRKGGNNGSVKRGKRQAGHCFTCGAKGHWSDACPEKKQTAQKTKGSFRPGKYDGSGRVGRVHAVSAEADVLSASDDELRSGNA